MVAEHSILGQLRQGCGELQADASEMLAARVELAQLEMRLASARFTRLAIVVGGCGLAALAGYVVLVQLAAEMVPAWGTLSYKETLAILGSGLIATGGLIAWFAVRRFRKKHRHFEQSIAEIKADLLAVQCWLDHNQQSN
jgi:hypothetical protein